MDGVGIKLSWRTHSSAMTARPTSPPHPDCSPGSHWQERLVLPGVELYLGDSLSIAPTLKGIDALITDPPYGITAASWDIVAGLDEILKSSKGAVAFSAEPTATELRKSVPNWRYDWKWIKNRPTGMIFAKHQPMRAVELVMVFGDVRYNPQKRRRSKSELKQLAKRSVQTVGSEVTRAKHGMSANRNDNQESYPVDTLFFDTVFNRAGDKTSHPSQKPVELMEYLIMTHSNQGETVLDPYMGSGTTGVACIRTGRKFVGIEKDPEHFKTACERIKRELAQGDLFLGQNADALAPAGEKTPTKPTNE
jgi:DNA modification methylase